MMFSRDARRLLAVLVAALALACSSDDGSPDGDPGEERPEEALNLIRIEGSAPPLVTDSISFWAVKGEDAEGNLYFQDSSGPGHEYLSLRIDDESLASLPDGTPIAEGDSVLITVKVVDPAAILFELEPTGLRFSADEPAELRIRYDRAGGDLNEDGDEDEDDDEVEGSLSIWRQESPGLPYVRLGTLRSPSQKELRADLTGFSRYAIAY